MSNTIAVRLPDGRQVNVQADTQEEAAKAAHAYWQRQQSAPSRPSTMPKAPPKSLWGKFYDKVSEPTRAISGAFVDQVLPNWTDEIAAVGPAALALFRGEDVGEAFRKGQRDYKADQKRLAAKYPKTRSAASVAGFGAGLALPAGKALEGASLGRKAIQGAAVGASYGAVSGTGEGEGLDLERRAGNAASSASFSALAGGGVPLVSRSARWTGRAAREYVPGVDRAANAVSGLGRGAGDKLARLLPPHVRRNGASRPELPSAVTQRAYRDVMGRMNEGHIDAGPGIAGPLATPQAIAAEVGRRNQIGVPAMVGDVSPAMRSLTASASRDMGPGQTLVREALEARKAAEGARVDQYIRDRLPTVPDPVAYVEDFQRQSRAAAAPLYAEAYRQPVYRSSEIQAIEQTPAFQDALPQAYRNIRNQIDEVSGKPKDPHAMGFGAMEVDPNGLPPTGPYFQLPDGQFVTIDEGLTAEGYDQVVRAMRDSGVQAAGRNPVTGRIENNTNSVHINSLAGQLRDELASQNAPYAQVVRQYGDDMAHANAFRQGQDIGKLTGPEIAAQARSMPEFAQEAWATGAGTAIADEASRYAARHPYGDVAGRASAMLGDDAKQAALSDITGNTGGVRDLQDAFEFERQATANWRGISKSGSPAASGGDGIPLSPRGFRQRMTDALAERLARPTQQEYSQSVADLVTSQDPQAVEDIARMMDEIALSRQARSDHLHALWRRGAGMAGRVIPPGDPVPDDEDQNDWDY